jgi:predicted NBD/HSP70 family sugar kinase
LATKRVKISFASSNQGKIVTIQRSEIAKTNERVKEAMKAVVREFDKKETQSQRQASELVLNA